MKSDKFKKGDKSLEKLENQRVNAENVNGGKRAMPIEFIESLTDDETQSGNNQGSPSTPKITNRIKPKY